VRVRSVLQTGQLIGHVIARSLKMNAFPRSAKPLFVGSIPTRASKSIYFIFNYLT
jgi:hypothetical protein